MTTMTMTTDTRNSVSWRDEFDRLKRILSASDIRLATMGEKNMTVYAERKALAGKSAI